MSPNVCYVMRSTDRSTDRTDDRAGRPENWDGKSRAGKPRSGERQKTPCGGKPPGGLAAVRRGTVWSV